MKLRHSLSTRLFGLFILTAILIVLAVRLGFEFGSGAGWWDMTRPHLMEYTGHILDEIGDPPEPARIHDLEDRLPVNIYVEGEGFEAAEKLPELEIPEYRMHDFSLSDGRLVRVGSHRGNFLLTARVSNHQISVVPDGWGQRDGLPVAGLVTIVGILLVLAFTCDRIRRMFLPIEFIRAGVARFGGGDLDHPIPVTREDELGDLSKSTNKMAEDIRAMLEAKRQLLLAISHELRSPLTRAKVNAELLEDSPPRSALVRDLNVIESLISELLETERLNRQHAALNLEAALPDELVQDVLSEFFQDQAVETNLAFCDVPVLVDPTRIKLLVRNLLDNSLRHTPDDAPPPEIRTRYKEASWELEVRDHGAGIPKEHLAQISEPFYRADPARQRATGGYGLGLYLCRVIAEAHGGSLEIESEEGQGTRVKVLFPRVKN